MVSESNIAFLRERKARYIVGTSKSQLRSFEAELAEEENWTDVQNGVEARIVEHPDGNGGERFVLCRSNARAAKERAMLERQMDRLSEEFIKVDRSLRRRPQSNAGPSERVEAHLLICFLSLALWRSLESWMSSKGLGSRAAKLLEAVGSIRSMDVIVPVKRGESVIDLRLRTVAKPDSDVAVLLAHLGLKLPQGSKLVQNVVEKNR